MSWKRRLRNTIVGGLAVLALAQLVPCGHDHSNPPITREPAWDKPETRALAKRACFDCHSNETRWPWYSYVAPVSWFVGGHVDEGRRALNFSEWDHPSKHAGKASHEVETGGMPLTSYLLLHGDARLGDAERDQLIHGLAATFGDGHRSP
ncbi:MAG: heme-binding domain-containing protein [Kofleriaceae bacterium]